MTPADYEYLSKFLKQRSGLMLPREKQYLAESRLMPLARRENLPDLSALIRRLRAPDAEQLRVAATEAMTINESFFFRDKLPFDRFRDTMLPALLKARATRRVLRIWCAAAATGQEPYSLAMLLDEAAARLAGWRIELLASDINLEVLAKARAGLYTQFEVQRGLPVQLLMRHFEQVAELWRISTALRAMVRFRELNMLDDFSSLGSFDVIFCRNLLIYFDHPTKTAVLERLAHALARDGYLVLGAAETVVGLTDAFIPHPEKRGLYIHNPEFAARAAAAKRGNGVGGERVA